MLRSAALASMVEASTPMRSPFTRPASAISARTQSNTAVWTSWGRRARVRDSQEWSGTRSRISNSRNSVATGNPSSATPAHAQSRYPRSSPPGAYGSSARVAPKAPPSWPRNRAGRPPRRSRRSRPRSVPTAGGRKIHDLASAASPTSSPSSPPDDPSAVPSPSANPLQARTPENQTMPTSSREDFVNGLLRHEISFHFGDESEFKARQ